MSKFRDMNFFPTHRATIEQLDHDGQVYRTFVRHGDGPALRASIERAYNMRNTRLTITAA